MNQTCGVPSCTEEAVGHLGLYLYRLDGGQVLALCQFHYGCVLHALGDLIAALGNARPS